MSSWLIRAGLLLGCALVAGCSAADNGLTEEDISPIDHQKMATFNQWLEEQKSDEPINAFKPRPMQVSGIGRVRAAPDIAVITGTIKTTADQDDTALDEAAKIINAVQQAVQGQNVELNFTQIATSEVREPECLARNQKAMARYSAILADNRYNANIKRQLEQGRDIKIEPRAPQNRLPQEVCPVTHIEATLSFAARVMPAAQAGNIINDFTTAGVSKVDLFGYDFSDYDALYKEASTKAVNDARVKAELIAKTAGTQLSEIVNFRVDGPQRIARFGPQAMIITNHQNRNIAAGNYAYDEIIVTGGRTESLYNEPVSATVINGGFASGASTSYGSYPAPQPAPAPPPPPQTFTVFNGNSEQVVQSTSTLVTNTGEIPTRVEIPIHNSSPVAGNNALKMSLQAGQRTITVRAYLNYLYETPIDGSVVPPNG